LSCLNEEGSRFKSEKKGRGYLGGAGGGVPKGWLPNEPRFAKTDRRRCVLPEWGGSAHDRGGVAL